MYDAKKLGRNNCQFFRADMQARVQDWQSLEGNLRIALDHNEFTLHYQPKINLITTEVSGVEACFAGSTPSAGVIQPMDFVPIAEESGLIVPIGQWVLQEACRQARAWIDAGLPAVRMAVNVSAVEFMSRDFLAGVRAALSATGIEPRNLELELTETVLMQDADGAMATLKALKSIGVQLAVDDFGTGYSSFSYLRKFPLDSLKVDRSFISEISPRVRQRRHFERHDQYRQKPGTPRRCRRRGNPEPARFSSAQRLHRRPGLLFLPSGDRRKICRVSGIRGHPDRRPLTPASHESIPKMRCPHPNPSLPSRDFPRSATLDSLSSLQVGNEIPCASL